MSTELIALVSVICGILGGALLKIVDKRLTRKEVEFDHGIEMAKDNRDQIKALQERQNFLELELTTWKDKYYRLMNDMADMKVERDALRLDVAALRDEVERLRGGAK
jgi:chromosome segregation ATPase